MAQSSVVQSIANALTAVNSDISVVFVAHARLLVVEDVAVIVQLIVAALLDVILHLYDVRAPVLDLARLSLLSQPSVLKQTSLA